jgi:hypothetical protein
MATNEEEHTVKQLCVELEEKLNSFDTVDDWSDFVQRCKAHWELASRITIERYPVTIESAPQALPVVPASTKVLIKNLATSTELMDVANMYTLKQLLPV